ncbi:unnamed protein product [Effrenium voratum]|nr:unnamed protein product [Effrenium voratum]
MWLRSMVEMTKLFRDNSLVVAFDIRNAILAVNSDMLIVVSALCCMDLRPVSHPIRFNIPNRLYIEFQIAALFSNNFISWREVGDIALYVLVALVVVDVLMLRGQDRAAASQIHAGA